MSGGPRQAGAGLGLVVLLMGAAVAVGWLTDIDAVKGIAPGLATMKLNTALCFAAMGGAVWTYARARRAADGLASFALLVGALSLGEYVVGFDARIDQLIVPDLASATEPGRMSPGTALCFVLIAAAFLLLGRGPRLRLALAEVISASVGVVAVTALLGYLYDLRSLYAVALFSTMAVHTAAGFGVLALAVMLAHEEHALRALHASDSPGAKLARGLLPLVIIVPAAFGYFVLSAERADLVPPTFSLILSVAGTVLALASAVIWTSYQLHRSSVERSLAEAANQRAEARLARAERTEIIARFAGGIAHDFNNILTVVVGQADLLLMEWPQEHPDRGDVEAIRGAGRRAQELTRQLLMLSRREGEARHVVDVSKLLDELGGLLARLIDESIDFAVHAPVEPTRVRMSGSELERVLTNLVVNARDAMPSGGKLTVEARTVTFYESQDDLRLEAGHFVEIAVSDTGHGMPAEVARKVFDPFFTTKPRGRGTGLGLATVHGVVTRAGGSVTVFSEQGVGTTFRIYLPFGDGEVEAPAAESIAPEGLPKGLGQAVLVLDDDTDVRAVARRLLTFLGYDVLEAATAEEAFVCVGRADVLLCDVVMPEASGPELVQRLQAKNPALRVLFMSGYGEEAIRRHGLVDAAVTVVPKPLSLRALAVAMHAQLSAT